VCVLFTFLVQSLNEHQCSFCFSVLQCLSNICLPSAATLPRKNSKNGVGPDQVPMPPPQEPPPQDLSDSDLDYDDVIGVLDMYNSEKVGGSTPRSKPQSLHPEGFRGNITRNEPSPTCSTPSSEVASPPPTLPKPLKTLAGKGAVSPNITPAIPIRRSSLKSGQQATTAPASSTRTSRSLQSNLPQPSRSETTTPNQPMVDIQQALKLKQTTGSPQSFGSSVGGGSDRVSPHPVSLAKALEMSNSAGFNSDCNDSCNCTGDSGFDEFTPVAAAWNKSVPPPPPRPKPKTLKQHAEQQQQSYTNITILSPTSPPSPPHHTSISHLAPIYGSNNTTPSPPTTDHTTVSPMGPMYNAITIEEQSQDSGPEDDNCPDYVNVKQYVEPT
jgi:hypothetical protein